MDSEREEQAIRNKFRIGVNPPMASMRAFPYYSPELQQMKGYPQMDMMNGLQSMNFAPQLEVLPNDPSLINMSTAESKTTQKSSPNLFSSEKQKVKPYVNLLVNTVNNLFKDGKITKKFLEEKTEPKISSVGSSSELSYLSTQTHINSGIIKHNSFYENSQSNYSVTDNEQCENPLCKHPFSSSKEKVKVKIRGLKTQEKYLCQKCSDAVEKENFCYYCNAIYRDDMTDGAVWVQCDYCKKWEHFECELNKGKRYSTTQELKDVKHYMCPICTNERAEKKIPDNKMKKKFINKKRRGDSFDEQKSKKTKRKELRNLKNEKCSELLSDVQLIESLKSTK